MSWMKNIIAQARERERSGLSSQGISAPGSAAIKPKDLAAARTAMEKKDWSAAVAAWLAIKEGGGVEERLWRAPLERSYVALAREHETHARWADAFDAWGALAALKTEQFEEQTNAGIRRTGVRAARAHEKDNLDAAMAIWRVLLAREPENGDYANAVTRIGVKQARKAEADSDWAGAADRWHDLMAAGHEPNMAVAGFSRAVFKLARAAEADNDWALALTLWEQLSRLAPDDARSKQGVQRAVAKSNAAVAAVGNR